MNERATVALLLIAAAVVSADDTAQVHVNPFAQVPLGPLVRDIEDGGGCPYSSACRSHCCSVVYPRGGQAGSSKTCRRLAELGEPCSEEQVKGGTYVNGCPCHVGYCGKEGYCKQHSEDKLRSALKSVRT